MLFHYPGDLNIIQHNSLCKGTNEKKKHFNSVNILYNSMQHNCTYCMLNINTNHVKTKPLLHQKRSVFDFDNQGKFQAERDNHATGIIMSD